MDEREIATFWETHPCNESQVRPMFGELTPEHEEFFSRYDKFRYDIAKEGHILACLDSIDFRGKRVLEIGLGQGAESEQIIRRGGRWSGIDLTSESTNRVATRLRLRKLPHDRIETGSAVSLPFEDATFDIVFSHGVLHHIPEIDRAQREIARVLKPGGELIVMLYARHSFEYYFQIGTLSRIALAMRYLLGRSGNAEVRQQIANAKEEGLARYLRMRRFIHRNTDGALNPYSKVYDLDGVRADFSRFRVVRHFRRYLSTRPRFRVAPLRWLRIDRIMGWHLWVHMRKSEQAGTQV